MSWYCGNHETFTVVFTAFNSFIIKVKLCLKFPWLIITPFGSDVEPDVYCRKAMSFSFGDGGKFGPLEFLEFEFEFELEVELLLELFCFPFVKILSTTIQFISGHFDPFDLNIPWISETFLAKL